MIRSLYIKRNRKSNKERLETTMFELISAMIDDICRRISKVFAFVIKLALIPFLLIIGLIAHIVHSINPIKDFD